MILPTTTTKITIAEFVEVHHQSIHFYFGIRFPKSMRDEKSQKRYKSSSCFGIDRFIIIMLNSNNNMTKQKKEGTLIPK